MSLARRFLYLQLAVVVLVVVVVSLILFAQARDALVARAGRVALWS